MAASIVDISHHSGTFVTVGEPTLTHGNHPQIPWLTLGFTLVVVHSVALDKYIMTCIAWWAIVHGIAKSRSRLSAQADADIHECNVIGSIFTALKVLCSLPIHSPPPVSFNAK